MPILPRGSADNINNGEIRKSKLLLVEGNDEKNFFEALLDEIELPCKDIQIEVVGGVNNLRTALPALINRTGFLENVESIAIVRDADDNFTSAFDSVCTILNNNNLNYPYQPNNFSDGNDIKVGIYIMPGNPEDGTMLEDLCIKTQIGNPIMDCVDSFFRCLESKIDNDKMPKNMAKARSQVFLAAMPKIVNSVGLGAKRRYWNLKHPCLDGLANFLKQL